MKLYYLPPSSYSQKVLITMHEKNIAFEPEIVNLFDPETAAKYREIYPIGKIPLLIMEDDHMIPEASIIVEYLDTHYSEGPRLIPLDPDESRKVRFHDRMLDLHLNDSAGPLFFELMKPQSEQDQQRVEGWRNKIKIMYDYLEEVLADNEWVYGNEFSLADISAVTALKIAQLTMPLDQHPSVLAYFERLSKRPSVAEAFANGQPYLDQMCA